MAQSKSEAEISLGQQGGASERVDSVRSGLSSRSHTDPSDDGQPSPFKQGLAPVAPQRARISSLELYLMRALDEIDYGVILLDVRQMVWHTNHLARVELTRGQLLHVNNGRLETRVASRQTALHSAIARAGQGIRSMVDLRPSFGDHQGTSIALVPMGHPAECFPEPLPVLAITCRQMLCEQISLHFFAQSYGLTRTEEAVLTALAQGMEVEDIVRERGLAMSTVRSHVKQLRIKTQSGSMRELLNKVSVLPPVVSSIKSF